MARYDAIVVGGGLLGSATAYHLVSAGARTLLVDRTDAGRATDAGAGILSPQTNTRDPEAWFNLAIAAAAYYGSSLIPRLQSEQEHDTGYAVCGSLLVAATEDEIAPFEAARELIFQRRDRLGSPSPDELYELDADAARERFPALADVHGAIYNARAARVDGRLLNLALRTAALSKGLVVRDTSVDSLVLQDNEVEGVKIGAEAESATLVAIAGGAWSDAFAAQLGVRLPLAPQRGQIIHLGLDRDTSDWPIVSAFHHHYMVPWPDRRVVVGATRETGSEFEPRTTAAGVREVLDEAIRVAPGLAGAEIREIRVGLRPFTEDTMPVLGDVPGVKGAFLVTGHGPTGLTLGPYSAKLVAAMMLGEAAETDISAFHVSRFQRP